MMHGLKNLKHINFFILGVDDVSATCWNIVMPVDGSEPCLPLYHTAMYVLEERACDCMECHYSPSLPIDRAACPICL